jgi:hypothetical protein
MNANQYNSFHRKISILLATVSLAICLNITTARATEITRHKNAETGLLTWTALDKGMSLELIQLLPDFVRAIYGSHGFPGKEIEKIAAYCVFGTIIKNTSQQQLEYHVVDWYYLAGDKIKKHPIKTKPAWLEQWRKAGVKFSWTLLPEQGVFEVGDWQQGFTTIGLPHDSTFDLIYKWTINGKTHAGKIENLRCAPEQPVLQ